jgi:hypothetical protein
METEQGRVTEPAAAEPATTEPAAAETEPAAIKRGIVLAVCGWLLFSGVWMIGWGLTWQSGLIAVGVLIPICAASGGQKTGRVAVMIVASLVAIVCGVRIMIVGLFLARADAISWPRLMQEWTLLLQVASAGLLWAGVARLYKPNAGAWYESKTEELKKQEASKLPAGLPPGVKACLEACGLTMAAVVWDGVFAATRGEWTRAALMAALTAGGAWLPWGLKAGRLWSPFLGVAVGLIGAPAAWFLLSGATKWLIAGGCLWLLVKTVGLLFSSGEEQEWFLADKNEPGRKPPE